MNKLSLIAAAGLVAVATTSASAAIVINEVDYDNIGTDNAEFIELFNPDATPQSLSGFTLVLYNGAIPTAPVVYASGGVVALTGSIPAGGYYVIGVGGNQALPFAADAIQNGTVDGFGIYSSGTFAAGNAVTSANLVTGIVYEGQGSFPAAFELSVFDDSPSVTGSLQRVPNGVGAFGFLPATPGAVNAIPEPTTLGLIAAGSLVMLRRRK